MPVAIAWMVEIRGVIERLLTTDSVNELLMRRCALRTGKVLVSPWNLHGILVCFGKNF